MSWPFSTTSTPSTPLLNAARLLLVTEPGVEPVTYAEMVTHLKLDSDSEQTYVEALIVAARRMFEEFTGKSLVNTVWRAHWDYLPRVGTYVGAPVSREIELPRAPLVSVAWIKYLDSAGVEQTFNAANYTLEAGLDPRRFSRLWLNADADWPELGDFPGALRCQFTAGYGAAGANVPAEIRAAIKLLAAHLFENRLPVNIGNIVNELPMSLRSIIELHHVRTVV